MGRYLFGLAVIITGVVLLFNNFGITEIEIGSLISTYWPILLVFWGIEHIFSPFCRSGNNVKRHASQGEIIIGAILTFVGIAFLGRNLGWLTIDMSFIWKVFWPAILILVGINFLRGKATLSGKSHVAIMGGVEQGKSSSWDLKSDSYYAIMGGIELDITKAEVPEGETVLDLTAVMGGIEIIVPKGLPIICEGMAVLGGVEFLGEGTGGIIGNKTMSAGDIDNGKKVLRIQARAFMGGIEVKSR
ncbi:MAG: DUF5668 domain-containing protein [Bacillota bacterium]|nr:DUF5668 domain-containing protein [Bacillota bacterium]